MNKSREILRSSASGVRDVAKRVCEWRWKTRYTRTIEAELARKDAENSRTREEITQVRADCARLRNENRALLNSILGIAGIPPIAVTVEEASEIESGAELRDAKTSAAAQKSSLGDLASPPPGSQADVPRSDPPVESGPEATTSTTPADKDHSLAAMVADGPVLPSFAVDVAKAVEKIAAGVPGARKSLRGSAVARGKNLAQVAPMRRRSWQQINRALEFEAARKKAARGAEEIEA